MKELIILRHAKSSWDDASLADHERSLNGRGKKAAKRMGTLLDDEGIVPDHIITSTAVRAKTTAARVARAAGYEGEIEENASLYHASPQAILAVVRQAPDAAERLLIVGHNPGFELLAGELSGSFQRFPTAALMHLALEDVSSWAQAPGAAPRVLGFWLPRALME